MRGKILLSAVTAGILFFGCGINVESDENSTAQSTTTVESTEDVSGNVVDGAIYNAKVCIDYNFNQNCDSDEPSAVTDINGSYSLSDVNLTDAVPLLVVPQANSVDVSTNEAFNKVFSAPAEGGSVNINPVTSLVGAYMYKLKAEGNLSKEAVENYKNAVAKAFGLNSADEFTSNDIRKNPELYAKAVAVAQIFEGNLSNVYNNIDLDILEDGNLTSALKNSVVADALNAIMSSEINVTSADVIQSVIENSIENNDVSTLTSTDEWSETALKDLIENNIFFKQGEEGLSFYFDTNGSFTDESIDDDGNIVKYTGTWEIVDNSVVLNYSNGESAKIYSLNKINGYLYSLTAGNSEGTITDTVLAMPKTLTDLSKLPGITPLSEIDIAGKSFTFFNNSQFIFNGDGSCELVVDGNSYECEWSVEDGVLIVVGEYFNSNIVRFDNNLFAFTDINNILTGAVIPMDTVTNYTSDVNTTVSSAMEFTNDMVANKTFAFDNDLLVFRDDSSWVRYTDGVESENGSWHIDNGKLMLDYPEYPDAISVELNNDFGSVIEFTFNNTQNIYAVVLNTADPLNVSVSSSDDLKSVIDLSDITPFTTDMLDSKTFYSYRFNKTMVFDSNGSVSVTDKDGNTKTGEWSVDSNGIAVLNLGDEIDYIVLGNIDNNDYKVVDFVVKGDKLYSSSPDVITTEVSYPIMESLGKIWGYNWYKTQASYPGDTRYIGNIVQNGGESIKLQAYRKDGSDSRAQAVGMIGHLDDNGIPSGVDGFSANVNLIEDNVYSYFQAKAVAFKYISTSSTVGDLKSDTNLTLIAGLSIRKNSITAYVELDDGYDNYYDLDVGNEVYDYNDYNLTDISDSNDLTVKIYENNNMIYYNVYNAVDNSLIFSKEYNISDLNITSEFRGFTSAGFRSRVDARETNNTLSDSLNYVNDFSTISSSSTSTETISSVDDFLSNLGFTPVSLSSDDVENKLLLFADGVGLFLNSDGTYTGFEEGDSDGHKGEWYLQDNVLVDDMGRNVYMVVKDRNGSYVNLYGYVTEDNEWFDIDAFILNATPDTKILDVDVFISLFEDTNLFDTLTADDLNDKTIYLDTDGNETIYLDSNGTFTNSWNEDGKTYTVSGLWTVDKNVMKFTIETSNDESDDVDVAQAYGTIINGKMLWLAVDENGTIVMSGYESFNLQ